MSPDLLFPTRHLSFLFIFSRGLQKEKCLLPYPGSESTFCLFAHGVHSVALFIVDARGFEENVLGLFEGGYGCAFFSGPVKFVVFVLIFSRTSTNKGVPNQLPLRSVPKICPMPSEHGMFPQRGKQKGNQKENQKENQHSEKHPYGRVFFSEIRFG